MREEIFSPMEDKVLEILGNRKMSIKDITDTYMKKSSSEALHPNQVISGAVKNINHKCDRHKLKWFINSQGLGRGGKVVWKDKR